MKGATHMEPKIYNAKEAAAYLRISKVTLYGLVENGQIHCFRVGRIYRFTEEQIQAFIDSGGSGSGCISTKAIGGDHNGSSKTNS
jgi:excisionase family DNA binding protein